MGYSLDALRLNHALELPPLTGKRICHSYACCCSCGECKDREKNGLEAPAQPKQPWELAA